ncbi:hypothetical protein [Desulfoscipio gibsoniae]|uniref:Uncharacterized protein n=1 Tax=Desulfoscipio gibsoniae DSM 7213 TaxID=767817 RepID=R4KFY9_9FIRM|nr:hypothetical protein [Desulfoscipio gibsoniae]AGL01499.1 hypothetical protein Desgi_2064 [Desulfoscipio gibsoniae DSM 7213]
MLIEIFTKQLNKKNIILTLLATEPHLNSTGEKITVPGLVLHITANYLLFNISSPAWAERIVPLLFSIKPINASGQLYEPVSDMKIIVTAKSFEPTSILPYLHELSHLDLERGELLGVRLVEWRSRDVAVVAGAETAVQGGIITARIKFNPHFRDSQYNCQACIDQVSIGELLKPLSPEFARTPLQPRITGPVIQARLSANCSKWAEFINRQSVPVIYQQAADLYLVDYGEAGQLIFKQKPDRREILCSIELTNPQIISADFIDMLHNLLGVGELTILHTAENILLPPEQLMYNLSFHKEPDFYSFTVSKGCFTGMYDIKKLTLTLSGSVEINKEGVPPDTIQHIHTKMAEYMYKVLEHAV